GVGREPVRHRTAGRRLDPARVRALALTGDPRVLIATRTRAKSDLFLGIAVDCSGSMTTRDNIEKARLFAALLAEACRDLSGVDLRVFGFTDQVIYDAGDAARPAVHALRASGGNNDAAALAHVGEAAHRSGRRAKLAVMISDGLPTECSVAAL